MEGTNAGNTANTGSSAPCNDKFTAASTGETALSGLASVTILSLNFQHTPSDPTCSAVHCRDMSSVFAGPEWKTGDTTVRPILYITGQLERIDVAISIAFVPPEGVTSSGYPITLYLLNSDRQIFNGELSAEYSLVSGENAITFSILEPKIRNGDRIANYSSKLKFSFSCGEQKQTTIQEFWLEVYVLPSVPANPISLADGSEDYYPNLDFINTILVPIPDYTPEGDPVLDMMKRLHSNPYLKFVPSDNDMGMFSTMHHELTPVDPTQKPLKTDVIQFDLAKFFDAYAKTGAYLRADSEVYAVLLMYGFCLLGKDAVVSHVIPSVDDDGKSTMFTTRDLYGAGSDGNPSSFELKYQAVVESNGLIYDASLRYAPETPMRGASGEPLSALVFEKDEYDEEEGYVDKVFVDETEAMPGGITNDISINGMVCQITPVQDEEESPAPIGRPLGRALAENVVRDAVPGAPATASDASPIIDVKVSAPDAGGNSTINVLYCFDSDPVRDQGYNYIYNNLPDGDGMLGVKLPFEGTVILDPRYEVLEVDSLDLHLALNKDDGNTVKYGKENYSRDRFGWEVRNSRMVDPSSSEGETSVSWRFDESWNTDLHVDASRDNICDIIARISLVVRKREDDGTKAEPFRLPVFLTSEYEGKPADPSTKLIPPVKITIRTSPIVSDPILKSVFTGSLNEARCYSSSGVARLPDGRQVFFVAGGMDEKDIIFRTGNATMDALALEDGRGLVNLGIKNTLSSGRYRTTGQVIRDSAGVQYFVVAGGCYAFEAYSNELEVFRVGSDASLTKVEGQTVVLSAATDHATSTVVTDGQTEYVVIVGGYTSNHVTVCSVGLDGRLLKVGQDITLSVCGASVGMMTKGGNRYLIVAGGVAASAVYVYRISQGGMLNLIDTLSLRSARGDSAYGVIEDTNGNEYFIAAGGRANYTHYPVFDEIDVFGFDEKGAIRRIDGPQPRLSMARFDLVSGVLSRQYFIAAGGYTGGGQSVCSTVDMFSIGTDGVLKQEKSDSLSVATASAVSGIISDGGRRQYFVIAGGSSSNATTGAVEVFELSDAKAQHERYA